jgi:hypothetical protein
MHLVTEPFLASQLLVLSQRGILWNTAGGTHVQFNPCVSEKQADVSKSLILFNIGHL